VIGALRPRPAVLLALAALAAPSAFAQLSPGPLARPHASLEGAGHCLDCHDQAEGVSPGKCLACHRTLHERVEARRGLHARPEYADCKTCHVDHQGRDFALVYWGQAGRGAFDHGLTGHPLEGRHRALACEACHGDPVTTFLGRDPACRSCHDDAHRGTRLAARPCGACHGQEGFRPAPGFAHGDTGFALEGAHASLSCDACHPAQAPSPARALRLGPAKGTDCASCHRDPHQGRLGASCARCHASTSWKQAAMKAAAPGFAHDRTRFPLRGRHVGVACASCHAPGRGLRLAHARCSDCHADAHLGQLAHREDRGRCEACHDEDGFVPARFGVDEHAKTAYPLEGAHLAVACDACHPSRLAREITAAARGPGGGRRTVSLRRPSTRCADCHADPHRGEVDARAGTGGCASCHRVSSWADTTFDHRATRFALTGAHAGVACAGCHPRAGDPPRPRLLGTPLACAGCHRDPHAGQFADGGATLCERCHTTTDLRAARFDHEKDAAFALAGAHARLACSACHREEARDGVRFVRYKPLGRACRDCHAEPAAGSAR
jgi:hypothetical protein